MFLFFFNHRINTVLCPATYELNISVNDPVGNMDLVRYSVEVNDTTAPDNASLSQGEALGVDFNATDEFN
jgi:hypothetical protein